MKTKQIPFNLGMAKKIQEGEIKGEIKTKCGNIVRILCFDLIDPRDVSFPYDFGTNEMGDPLDVTCVTEAMDCVIIG